MIRPEERLGCPHELLQSAARLMAGAQAPRRDVSWIGDELKVSEKGDIALFVGCLPFFDLTFRQPLGIETIDIARAAIRLLNRVGVTPVLLAEERCCGHDLAWAGDKDSFIALARANAKTFAERGVKHIVTACAECCRTWRLDYPEIAPEFRPKVEHLAEFLAPRVEKGEIVFRNDGSSVLSYQDPCRLGRHLSVYEPPRQVLAAMPGTDTVEMQRNRADAACCGTSGFIHCDAASRRLQIERLRSAKETGADKLVTACPKCLIHFSCAQADARRRGAEEQPIEVVDLTVLAASMLQEDEQASTSTRPSEDGRVEIRDER
jgi:Fe-S oxidoreductase